MPGLFPKDSDCSAIDLILTAIKLEGLDASFEYIKAANGYRNRPRDYFMQKKLPILTASFNLKKSV